MMQSQLIRPAGSATVPPEVWDQDHPDHDQWVGERDWCYDADCERHGYGPPS